MIEGFKRVLLSKLVDYNGNPFSSSNPLPVEVTNKALLVNDGAVTADDGVVLPLESLAKSYGYTGDNLTTITVSYNSETYVKTLTYTGDKLTATSVWVKQ